MKLSFKKILLLLIFLIIGIALYYGIQAGKIATSYVAKIACSCTFVSERPLEDVQKTDISKYSFIDVELDKEDNSLTASVLGLIKRKAVYRKGLGCTLVSGIEEEELRNQIKEEDLIPLGQPGEAIWPNGDSLSTATLPDEVDSMLLSEAVEKAFSYPQQEEVVRTRAVLVVYKGKIIAERYAEGFSADTPLLGWSMTKSITNALLGVLVKDNKINVKDKAPIKEWQSDERAAITIDQLHRMSSGLEFKEIYNIVADATRMLFNSYSASKVAIEQPLIAAPDEVWSYSSGTTNILSEIIKDKVGGDHKKYFNFPREVLFKKIGMSSAVIEPDPSGVFVGSSFMYATARDWARFGLLYLHDGVWGRERILPEGWVKYSATPTPAAPQGQYGAHFWLNAGEDHSGANRKWPRLPKDLFHAAGFEGQNVVILPSHDMVIVRLGNTQIREAWDVGTLVEDVLKALGD